MSIRSIQTTRLTLGLGALGLIATAAASTPAKAGPKHGRHDLAYDAVRQRIDALDAGTPIQVDRLTVIPLRREAEPTSTRVTGQPSLLEAYLDLRDRTRPSVRLVNTTSRPVLATGGRVLYGNQGEYVLTQDVLVPAEGQLRAIVAAACDVPPASDEETELNWYPRFSPLLVKSELALEGSRRYLERLVSQDGACDATSLRDRLSSEAGRALDPKLDNVLHAEAFRDDAVVGFAAGIDGRLVALHVFAAPHLHRAKAAGLLSSIGLYAEATETRDASSRVRPLSGATATHAVVRATNDALHTLKTKANVAFEGRRNVILEAPGLAGFGSLHGANPIHLSIKLHDPKREAVIDGATDTSEPS